jgi:hypothetical protein
MLEVLGGRTENQDGHPVVSGIPSNIVKPFAHRTETAQVVMLVEQFVEARYLGGHGDLNADLV